VTESIKIVMASGNNDNDTICMHLKSDPEYLNLLIARAVEGSNTEFVGALLRQGANVNTIIKNANSNDGRSLLYIAAANSNIEMIRVLLSHNPNLYQKSVIGHEFVFPITVAFRYANIEIFKELANYHVFAHGINDTIDELDTQTLLLFIVRAYRTYQSYSGIMTRPLVLMIQYLLDLGANPNLKTSIDRGFTWSVSPKGYAKEWDLLSIVALFRDHQAIPVKGVHCS